MNNKYWIFLLIPLWISFCGCEKKEPTPVTDSNGQEVLTTPALETNTLKIREEAPLPASALSELPSVQETLDKMIKAYKELDSYTDRAVCRAYIRRGELVSDQSYPFSVSFAKPNKMRFSSRSCEICVDGKTISVFIPSLPGVILQQPCPKELTLDSILFDQSIDEAVAISQAGNFSILPLQWVLLFASDPLKTITFGQTEIRMLAPSELNGQPCYRIRIERAEGPAVLWIAQSTGLLLRAQLPAEMLNVAGEGTKPDDCSLTIEFYDAQINAQLKDETFQMEIPAGTQILDHYTPPTIALLGKPMPPFIFSRLDNKGKVTNDNLKDKVTVLDFWITGSKLAPSTEPMLEQLRQKYAENNKVAFLSVSTDESSVSDTVLKDTFKQWNVKLPLARDINSLQAIKWGITSVPAIVLINQQGQIENIQLGFNPLLVNETSQMIDQLLEGKSLATETLVSLKAEAQQYTKRMKQWLANGIYVDVDAIQQVGIPDSTAAKSAPSLFELKPLWTASAIQSPGGLLAKDSSDDTSGRIWTIENGKKVVEIDQSGAVVARYDLGLDSKEVCSYIRVYDQPGKDENAKPTRYYLAFAPGQQRIHVYNDQWKLMFHYPEDPLKITYDGIYDARFGNISDDDDSQPEIYLAYLGTRGVQSIDISGKLRWSNRALGTVYSIVPYSNGKEKLILCTGTSGAVTVLNTNGKNIGDGKNIGVIVIKDQSIASVYAADLNNSGSDNICGLSVYDFGAQRLFGFDMRGTPLWSYDLPKGLQKRPIDYVSVGRLLKDGSLCWIALGPDGSIHLIDSDGVQIDQFNHGKFVYGLTTANWQDKKVLILSDDSGVNAYEIIWK